MSGINAARETPTTRFSGRAEDYAKYRPNYPEELIATTLADLGPPALVRLADIGAGTGISSDLYARIGVAVTAVEPNADMLTLGQSQHPNFTFVRGTAEQTGLSATSFDLIIALQAFHWFDPTLSLREFHRILRPSGRVALAWNIRDTSDTFTGEYSRIVDAYGDPNLIKELNSKHQTGESLLSSDLFGHGRKIVFSHKQHMDLHGLLGRMRSVTYLPKTGPVYDELEEEMSKLYRAHADKEGQVLMRYKSILYMGETH